MGDTPVARIKSLTFQDGTTVDIPRYGVVVIIGPNNVGKTTALMEAYTFVSSGRLMFNGIEKRVLSSAELELASDDEIMAWAKGFEDPRPPDPLNTPDARVYRNWSHRQTARLVDIPGQIRAPGMRQGWTEFLASFGARAQFEGTIPDFYAMSSDGNHQFDQLYRSPELEAELSKLSVSVFGTPVSLSRGTRQSVLHFGSIPDLGPTPSDDQIQELLSVPRVSAQGDGVKMLLNYAITLRLGDEPMVFLDEPEAHLHPPQAFQAANFVAQRGKRSQVFIVTHSIDFLHGLLDSSVPMTIVRLDRSENRVSASVLARNDLTQSWRDTTVRFSGALAGLMHRGVVLCEGDGDCRYFEVGLQRFYKTEIPHDLRFVHAGGKAGLKKLARVLRSVKVPTSVVTDFDFLRQWSEVRELYTILGGDAASIQGDWTAVNQYLSSIGERRTISDLRTELSDILDSKDQNALYSAEVKKLLAEPLKVIGGWAKAKKEGLRALRGEALNAGRRLLTSLSDQGIHVVPAGELESLHTNAPTSLHGPAFVNYVIENELYSELTSEEQAFILGIAQTCP